MSEIILAGCFRLTGLSFGQLSDYDGFSSSEAESGVTVSLGNIRV